jgi:hypothetical protein
LRKFFVQQEKSEEAEPGGAVSASSCVTSPRLPAADCQRFPAGGKNIWGKNILDSVVSVHIRDFDAPGSSLAANGASQPPVKEHGSARMQRICTDFFRQAAAWALCLDLSHFSLRLCAFA